MKTAIKELIESLKQDEISEQNTIGRICIRNCIILATSLLEKEKEQIINAAHHGVYFENSPYKNAEEYYSETFVDNPEAGI